jgi:magnesium-transporting ATPase (P-type)
MAGPSLTLTGIMGTRAVLTGIAVTVAAQAAFTWWPPMNRLFQTVPLGPVEILIATGAGVSLFAVIEIEKRITRLITRRH